MSSDTPRPFAYIGRAKCGCVRAMIADGRTTKTAQNVITFLDAGLAVERVPLEEGHRLFNAHCPHQRNK